MSLLIPKSFSTKTGSVQLSDLDTNFTYLTSTVNTALDITGTAVTAYGTLGASGAVTLANTLNVAGVTTLTNNLNVSGTVGATGAVTLASTLDVTGAATLRSASNTIPAGGILSGTDVGSIKAPGTVVQCIVRRYDGQTSYTTGTSTSGVEITDLRVTITPKYSNSLIYCIFQIFGEGQGTHDYIYKVFKNGTVPTGTYAGFNTVSGNLHYSGIAQALPYEGDYNSTPYATTMQYHDYPGTSGAAITYAPGVKDTYGTSRLFYVNRTVGTPQNGYEVGVSFATAWEIAQ